MFRKKQDKELNYTKINDLVSLSHNVLRILFILLIIIGVLLVYFIISRIDIKEVQILPFVLTVLGLLSPLFIGIVVAWLFDPFVTYLNKKGIRRGLGAAISYAIFLGIIVLILTALIPLLSEQVNDFVTTTVPALFTSVREFIDNFFNSLNNIENFDAFAMRDEIFNNLESIATNLTSSLPDLLVSIVTSLFSGIGVFAVGLIIGFYLLLDFDKNTDTLFSLVPKKYRSETKKCLNAVNKPLKRFVNGALIDCSIIFVVTTIGFSIIGLKAPLLFAVFCAITNVIPYAGPYIGGAPAVLVGLTQSPTIGIAVLIFIVVVQAVEGNLLQPFIMSKTTKLNPVTIILGLLVFGYFFGILGMILSTPIIGAIKELINFFDEKYDFLNFEKDSES